LKLTVFNSNFFIILSCSFLFILKRWALRVSAEKIFQVGEEAKVTLRPKNSTNQPLLHFISGMLEGALGMHPGLTSRKRCTKSPA